MPKTLVGVLLILVLAALVPFGLIALARSRTSPTPALHPILDMDRQPRFKAQRENPMFADGRAMRPSVPGTVARDDLILPNEVLNDPAHPRMVGGRVEPIVIKDAAADDRVRLGIEKQSDGKVAFVAQLPVPVDLDLMRRGQERFGIYCAPCHGYSGYGDGMVARRAAEMQAAGASTASGWVAPTNYHGDEIRGRPVGHLFNTITNGIRTMPAHGGQVSVMDRWAIVAYVKALQRSQNATSEDVPETERASFGN
jgi:mono/diheme cytochrome c family protein